MVYNTPTQSTSVPGCTLYSDQNSRSPKNPDKLLQFTTQIPASLEVGVATRGRRYIFPSFSHVNLVSPRHTTQPRELFSTNQNPPFRFVTGTQNHLGTSRGRMSSVGNSTLIYYPSLLSDGARFCFFTCLFFPRAAL